VLRYAMTRDAAMHYAVPYQEVAAQLAAEK
jgi:hypothetical protein